MRGYRNDDLAVIWKVPVKGTLRGRPVWDVPLDAVWDARNVLVRRGGLQPRPGLTQFSPALLNARPTGGINTTALAAGAFQEDAFQEDAFQLSSGLPTTLIVVATTRGLWAYLGGTFVDITDSPLTAEAHQLARFTAIEIGGTIWILHTNGRDVPRQWDAASLVVSQMTGWPAFTDWATVSDRIIGIVPPYMVRWGEALSLAAPPTLNARNLADTGDTVVAIRNLGTQRAVVYKTRSIWLVTPQGGSSPRYFRFEYRGPFEGPASPSAVVDVDGLHAYMTVTGRLALFDGFSHLWVVDGIQPILEDELDTSTANRVFGAYNPRDREVYFYYPMKGDNGDLRGLVALILPRPQDGILEPVAFVGTMGFPVSAAVDLRQFDNSVLVFGSVPNQERAYTVGGSDDAGTPITGFWQTGLVPAPSLDGHRIEAIETLALRGEGYGAIRVRPVFSNLLEREGGTAGPDFVVDLSKDTPPPRDPRGVDIRGQLFGLRYEFVTPVTLRWFGSRLAARRVE